MPLKYQIFISYRRDGGESLARLLKYVLTERGFNVFFDVESLRSGDFNKALFDRIAECTDVLVVLPPNGLDRCSDPNDWVRLEIARALKLEKNVIPVMMRNFQFPDNLPEDIAELQNKNGVTASNDYFDATIEKLVSQLLHSKPFNSDEQLLKDAEEGDISAMNAIGLRYEFGVPANRRAAFSFYEKSAATGDPSALYNLGDVYERCEKDLSLVYDYGIEDVIFQKNADEARTALHKLAIDCYSKSAEVKFAPAIYRLANLAEDALDFENAIKLYQVAADLNYPPAQNALGYYKMHGTNIDPDSAIALYEKAANAGYAPAIYNYARAMELKGNIAQAIELYERVAAYSIPQAAFSLAKLYENRLNDLRRAIDFYRIAYEKGIQEAGECLQRCQDKLFNKT